MFKENYILKIIFLQYFLFLVLEVYFNCFYLQVLNPLDLFYRVCLFLNLFLAFYHQFFYLSQACHFCLQALVTHFLWDYLSLVDLIQRLIHYFLGSNRFLNHFFLHQDLNFLGPLYLYWIFFNFYFSSIFYSLMVYFSYYWLYEHFLLLHLHCLGFFRNFSSYETVYFSLIDLFIFLKVYFLYFFVVEDYFLVALVKIILIHPPCPIFSQFHCYFSHFSFQFIYDFACFYLVKYIYENSFESVFDINSMNLNLSSVNASSSSDDFSLFFHFIIRYY